MIHNAKLLKKNTILPWLFILCLTILAAEAIFTAPALAFSVPEGKTIVRVALGTGLTEAELTIRQGTYQVVDLTTQKTQQAAAGARLTYSLVAGVNILGGSSAGGSSQVMGSRVLIIPEDQSQTNLFTYGSASYRGSAVVQNINGSLYVINVLDVEDYLLGVVPREMGMANNGIEAYKSQAVVCRTYALKKKEGSVNFDLYANQNDQSYGGYNCETSYTTAAVEATKGQVLCYDGQLITAYYSASAGGYTEDSENVWGGDLPYAKAVPSPYDSVVLQRAQDSSGYPGYTYSWQVRYTLAELQSRIAQWNANNPSSAISIGSLQSLSGAALAFDPDTRKATGQPNASGRITQLTLKGSQGSFTLNRESVRSFLGLRSTKFSLIPEGGVAVYNSAGVVTMLEQSIRQSYALAADGKPLEINAGSDVYYVATADGVKEMGKDAAATVQAYTMQGSGYGHGVGMSQWGAIGMADAGYTYQQILEHYYNADKTDGRLSIVTVG
ncbi:MAG: SpoIID/LytB domain-containing protein [Peptococcaceae bacterium]|nr:SpoIID/LytB domain-containing protein [Peptococcaceae bacterium]